MPDHKSYTHVRLILDDGIRERYEVRVSTFIEFDDNAGRRAISGKPTKKQAENIAKEIARSERVRTGAPEWK
jgi:hypothetical protein